MKDSLSVMGLRAGFLEAYSREPYSERSTSLFHRRVVLEVIWGPTNCSVKAGKYPPLIWYAECFDLAHFINNTMII